MTIYDGKDSSMQPPANAIILPTLNEEVGDSGSGSDSENDAPVPAVKEVSNSNSGHDETHSLKLMRQIQNNKRFSKLCSCSQAFMKCVLLLAVSDRNTFI